MLYQPTGTDITTLSLFEFDARTYFTPVPEPATLALLACGGMMALALRRRLHRAA